MLKLFVAIFFLVKTIDADWIEECLQLKATAKSSWPDLALDPANQNYSEVALRNIDLPHHLLNRSKTGLFRRILWRVVQSRHFQMSNLYQMYLQTDALIAELQLHLDKPAYRVFIASSRSYCTILMTTRLGLKTLGPVRFLLN